MFKLPNNTTGIVPCTEMQHNVARDVYALLGGKYGRFHVTHWFIDEKGNAVGEIKGREIRIRPNGEWEFTQAVTWF